MESTVVSRVRPDYANVHTFGSEEERAFFIPKPVHISLNDFI